MINIPSKTLNRNKSDLFDLSEDKSLLTRKQQLTVNQLANPVTRNWKYKEYQPKTMHSNKYDGAHEDTTVRNNLFIKGTVMFIFNPFASHHCT